MSFRIRRASALDRTDNKRCDAMGFQITDKRVRVCDRTTK